MMAAETEGASNSRSPATRAADGTIDRRQVRVSLLLAIPEPWRNHYERTSARYGRAVVAVRDLTCLGCYTRVPAGMAPRSRSMPVVTRCECCGRLLLWAARPTGPADQTP